MPKEITMKGAIACVQVFADAMAQDIDASALSIVPGVVRIRERGAELAQAVLVNKTLLFPADVDHSANGVALVANLVWQSCGWIYTKPTKIEPLQHSDRLRLSNGSDKR